MLSVWKLEFNVVRCVPFGLEEFGDTGVKFVRVVKVVGSLVLTASLNVWNCDWNDGSFGAPFWAKASANVVTGVVVAKVCRRGSCDDESIGFDSHGLYWGCEEMMESPFSVLSINLVSV